MVEQRAVVQADDSPDRAPQLNRDGRHGRGCQVVGRTCPVPAGADPVQPGTERIGRLGRRPGQQNGVPGDQVDVQALAPREGQRRLSGSGQGERHLDGLLASGRHGRVAN